MGVKGVSHMISGRAVVTTECPSQTASNRLLSCFLSTILCPSGPPAPAPVTGEIWARAAQSRVTTRAGASHDGCVTLTVALFSTVSQASVRATLPSLGAEREKGERERLHQY